MQLTTSVNTCAINTFDLEPKQGLNTTTKR